ncbi:MAG: VanZ family protein [Gammaproteobacteria bacterium]|nr:VanZ family protein [Gammaproteobacteria bacterium]
MIRFLSRPTQYLLTFFLLLLTATLHFINPPPIEVSPIFGIDKFLHFLMFFSLSLWSCFVFSRERIKLFIIFLILYGLMLELMQMAFFPLRSFEWMDWLFDALGVLVGFFTFTKKL